MSVPSILANIPASGSKAVDTLARNTNSVIYAGAGLSEVVGNQLAEHGMNIINIFGM
jgi:hypothetical protein